MDTTVVARAEDADGESAVTRDVPRPIGRSAGTGNIEANPAPADASVSDRRGVVKLLAASAVGAVAGAALNGRQVGAIDNQPVLQGVHNDGTKATWIYASDETAVACHSDGGYGMGCWGPSGNAWFFPFNIPPVGRPGDIGGLWVDGDGNWWAATATGTDGDWRKLAGPATAGALHMLEAPKRVYDSRPGESPAIDPKSPLTPNVPRTIDPKLNSSGVPPIARAVLITLTVPALGASGYATVWPSGAWPGTSNINFSPNQNIATTTVVGLGPGATFLVQSNVATNVIVDIAGYYV